LFPPCILYPCSYFLQRSVRVTRETEPEAIDKLQRRKLELEIEIHALEREKDPGSKERLKLAQKAIADVEDQLRPLRAAYENEKSRADEINVLRRRLDELKVKVEDAERRWVVHWFALLTLLLIVISDAIFQLLLT
jgi:ATP-dependent Clp protease ATP-binding subunit ClpA